MVTMMYLLHRPPILTTTLMRMRKLLLEPFRSVVKNQIRSKMSDEVMPRTINLVLCVVGRKDMAVSASGIAKFRKKVEQETLNEFESKELGHICLKMDGKDLYFCFIC